jgi:zinc transporter ZupT
MKPFFLLNWPLICLGLLAAAGNLLGGLLITRTSGHGKLTALIGLGAGFMLAAVFLEVIPEVSGLWPGGNLGAAMGWLLAGYLLLQLAEHTLAPHFHFGEETHAEAVARHGVAVTAVIALSIHAFFDGVAIASGMLTAPRLGLLLSLAILLHKVPEGFTVASIVLSSGRGAAAARRASLLIGAATFAGILSIFLLQPAIKYTLPFSAGVTLYVAASDLIPEVNHAGEHGGAARASLPVFAGVALFALTHLLLHAALD